MTSILHTICFYSQYTFGISPCNLSRNHSILVFFGQPAISWPFPTHFHWTPSATYDEICDVGLWCHLEGECVSITTKSSIRKLTWGTPTDSVVWYTPVYVHGVRPFAVVWCLPLWVQDTSIPRYDALPVHVFPDLLYRLNHSLRSGSTSRTSAPSSSRLPMSDCILK